MCHELHGHLLRLHAAQDIRQFWVSLQAVLGAAAPHDALIAYLNFLDFSTTWRAAKILTTPNARRSESWFEARRRVDMTVEFVRSRPPGLRLYRLSDVVADRHELRRSAFFRNYLAPGGWHHFVSQLFWRGDQVGSQIALRRTAEQGDFTAAEMARLEALHPHIEVVLNRLLMCEEERARRKWLEQFNDDLPFALLSLNWKLEPVYANRHAFERCATWNFGSRDARRYHARAVFQTPEQVLSGCAGLKERWVSGAPGREASLTVVHPTEEGLRASISMRVETGCPGAQPGFLVHFEHRGAPGDGRRIRDVAETQALLGNLTQAEGELVRHVCQGMGNREIAELLEKSVATVKGQLTSVYRKLKVPSRSRLLAEFAPVVGLGGGVLASEGANALHGENGFAVEEMAT